MKRFKKDYYYLAVPILAFVLFIIGWISFGGRGADYAPLMTSPSAAKEISVVLDKNYPPFSFQNETGEAQGILIDEWRLWEKKTGVRVKIVQQLWANALSEMEKGNYDVIDTIFQNSERDKVYDFTEPYANIEVPIFFHRNISGIIGVESIKGFTVAVKKGDNAADVLKRSGISNLQLFDTEEAIILAAKKGDVVVFVMDKPPASYFMYKWGIQKDFNFTKPLYTGAFHRAVRKGNGEMLKLVQNGFSKISAEEYRQISEKWYGKSQTMPPNAIRWVTVTLAGIGIIILTMVYWNMSLKKRVERKTRELTAVLKALEKSNQKINGIISAIPDLFFLLNEDGVYLDYLSKAEDTDLYLKPEFFIGKSLHDTIPQDIANNAMEKIKLLKSTKKIQLLNYELPINDNLCYYEARFVLLDEETILCIIRDISEKKKNEDLLYSMSIHDIPTGLFNRNYFEERIRILTESEAEDIGIIICDIDGLKLVNDTLGHGEGDNYLKTVAKILMDNFPEDSIVSRIGGDEFAVICPNMTQKEIQDIKVKIRGIIEAYNEKGRVVPISLSIGYAIKGKNHRTMNDALKEADDFMYREKLHHRQSIRSHNIDLLSNMLAEKHFDGENHLEAFTHYMIQMAIHQGILNERLKDIRLLAQFYDIGKIGISESILFKNEELTPEEWIEIKRHPEIGYRIAESSAELRPISEWIFKHHERWDGSGYPFGLKGLEIPVQCRIIAILDSYFAMISDRPYRKAYTDEKAIEEIKKGAGTEFDPALVDIFFKLLQEKMLNG